jgi:MFS transporter, ACS family, D-galactonate transporter
VPPAVAVQRLIAASQAPKADLAYLATNGPKVQKAAKDAPIQWRTWWWLCLLAEVGLLPMIFVMKGWWSPTQARNDEIAHEKVVQAELAAMAA